MKIHKKARKFWLFTQLFFLFRIFSPQNPENSPIKSPAKTSLGKCTVKYNLEKAIIILVISTTGKYFF